MHPRTRLENWFLIGLVLGMSVLPLSPVAASETVCFGRPVTVSPTPGSLEIEGTEGPDVIDASGGAYVIYGLEGNDRICGGTGDDEIYGDAGKDRMSGGAGNDLIHGWDGEDILRGGSGDDRLYGDGDNVMVGGWNDEIDGGSNSQFGGDWIYFSYSVEVNLEDGTAEGGDEGQDVLRNVENVYGSSDADTIIGDHNANYLLGWGANDVIRGKGGSDAINGMAGDDQLFAGGGIHDWLVYFDAVAGVSVNLVEGVTTADDQIDALDGVEHVIGSDQADHLYGNDGENYLVGGAGVDSVRGAAGNDYFLQDAGGDSISGGSGAYDVVDYSLSASGITVDLAAGSDDVEDQLFGVEGLVGSNYSDTLTGNVRRNYLFGKNGDDVLRGKRGNDGLAGGRGEDTLFGGPASDSCIQAEHKTGCEKAAPPEDHPLFVIGKTAAVPNATEVRPPRIEQPRRHK